MMEHQLSDLTCYVYTVILYTYLISYACTLCIYMCVHMHMCMQVCICVSVDSVQVHIYMCELDTVHALLCVLVCNIYKWKCIIYWYIHLVFVTRLFSICCISYYLFKHSLQQNIPLHKCMHAYTYTYMYIKTHDSEAWRQEVAIRETKIMQPLSELLYSPQHGWVYRNSTKFFWIGSCYAKTWYPMLRLL